MCFVQISQQKSINSYGAMTGWSLRCTVSVLPVRQNSTVKLYVLYTLAFESIAITFRLTNLSNSMEFCYSSQLTVALLSKKVTASSKTIISITVFTQVRHSMISFYILKIIYLKFILLSSSLRA